MNEVRQTEYPTGREDGMSFINNQWVFTGPEGYRVVRNGSTFDVVNYAGSYNSPVYGGLGLTEDQAHEMAGRLAGK